ncbi:MAG: chemotaxis protein CheX [Candidatus Sulfotelmatobacter sp.]
MSTAPKAVSTVADRTQWLAILRETAVEVFATVVGVAVLPDDAILPPAGITAMVGIAGPLCATLGLRCSLQSATSMAAHMLGVSLLEAAPQQSDALGEICNIVAGYFKAKIGFGGNCVLSVPTVVVGTNYKICSQREDLRIKVPLRYESASALVSLDVKP